MTNFNAPAPAERVRQEEMAHGRSDDARQFAARFVAGETLDEAIAATRELKR